MIIENAHSPKFNDTACTSITLMVKFKELPMEVPYVASPNDSIAHGKELFNNAVKGNYGIVRLYEPPVISEEEIIEKLTNEALAKRSYLFKESDGQCYKYYDKNEPLPLDLALYRQALRDITQQANYPKQIEWPTKPF